MSVSDTVEQQLPYLRRYGRAVTGSADLGDLAVETTLETLLAEVPEDVTRVSLFKALDETLGRPKSWSRRAFPVSPPARRALLLTAMEGLNRADAGRVLDLSEIEVARLLDTADPSLALPQAAKVFIIEDEPLIVASLSQIVTSLGHVVVGTAATLAQAVPAAVKLNPDLVLADIQLADGSQGTDAVEQIRQQIGAPAVFVTAFPERLLAGRAGEPTFLVPKPFRPAQVKAVIGQALFVSSLKQA